MVITLVACANLCLAQECTITMEVDGELASVSSLAIGDAEAVVTTEEFAEHFDLVEERWYHEDLKQWISMAQSQEWLDLSIQQTEQSLHADTVPKEIRSFVEWMIDPVFEITMEGDTLTMVSGQVNYRIITEEPDFDTGNYFVYARLNAYKKAMVDRKLPPMSELKVIEELSRRGLVPVVMEVELPAIPQAPTFRITTESVTKADGVAD